MTLNRPLRTRCLSVPADHLEGFDLGDVISLNDWKKEHGIPLPNSPYFTLKATDEQVEDALQSATRSMYSKEAPYAVIVGYKSRKTGDVKLLKELRLYPDRETLEAEGTVPGHYCVGFVRD